MQGTDSVPELFTPEFMQDPHALQATLREEAPARQVVSPTGVRMWVVSRYEEARSILADPTVLKDSERMAKVIEDNMVANVEARRFAEELTHHMLSSDPPDHSRLRRLVTKAFTARRIEQLRPRIEAITAELLEAQTAGDRVDLLDTFAFPLPITVISELLGVPEVDRESFRHWSNVLVGNGGPEEIKQAGGAMAGYLAELIAAKRANPADDMLSALVQATEDSDRLSEVELVSMAFLLLVAGHETTVNLIGNGVLALLNHPEQLAALRADRSLLPGAVEEFLRYESPVNMSTFRFTSQPLELDGVTIPADQVVLVGLGSANRDSTRFPDADGFDITRPLGGHLAFGHGIHYCLGAPLARLEAEIAFDGLLNHFPDIQLAVPARELHWRNSLLMRGLEELPVVL